MKRKEFIKSGCTLGICSCTGFSFITSSDLIAKSNGLSEEKDWRIGFMQRRFAKLLDNMNTALDEQSMSKIFEEVGRFCAAENSKEFEKFKNNLEGFLEESKKIWTDNFEYDKDTQTIHLYGKKGLGCGCPFADKAITPAVLCNCSIGFAKEQFKILLGKPVDVAVEESVLRGGERCTFEIRVKE